MKQLSATEARKDFFRLLDRAAKGEPVVIERKGVALRLVRAKLGQKRRPPDYRKYIHGLVDRADRWSWEWSPEKGLIPKDLPSR